MALTTRSFIAAINHLLEPAAWARERLAPHAGRCAHLRVEPVEILFGVTPDGFLIESAPVAAPAVTLSIPLSALPHFAGGDHNKAMNAVRIEGNADFADALGFVFRNLHWDAEEDLSRIFGDIVAHRLVAGAQTLKEAHQRAWSALTGNLVEYLTEEQQSLITRPSLEAHADRLRQLRDDIARLGKRIDRLSAATRH